MTNEVFDWLEEELAIFPDRTSGHELRDYLIRRTAPLLDSSRQELIDALMSWLLLRKEPRTMLAMDIAASHHLIEMRGAVEQLLNDVRSRRAFLPHYEDPVLAALESL